MNIYHLTPIFPILLLLGSDEEQYPDGKEHLDRGTIALSGEFIYVSIPHL